MGALPAIFDRDRTKADDFIEELKAYVRLNRDVPGMESYIKRVSLALTLIKGHLVAGWQRDLGAWVDGLGPQDDIPAVWDQFLDEFTAQFLDTQKAQ